MRCPSTPADPWLRATFRHAASRVAGPVSLSTRLNHLNPFDAILQRRHHALRPDRSFRPPPFAVTGFCPLCSPLRHCRDYPLLHPGPRTSDFLPPFPRSGFASRSSAAVRSFSTTKALTPAGLTQTARSLRLQRIAVPTFPPQPRELPAGRFVSRRSAYGCFQASPFMSRLATVSRRNRLVIPRPSPGQALRTAGSPPVALHPASQRRSYLRLLGCDHPTHRLSPCRQRALADALMPGAGPAIHASHRRIQSMS
jgi:hypothetical protein